MRNERVADAVVVKARDETFVDKVKSKICQEIPAPENPYIADRVLWHGYDVIELMRHRSVIDVVYLMIKGELPSASQARQLEQTLILLANPGPRHASTRAVMNASVSKTDSLHLLPIGMALMGGEHLGAAEVRDAIKFFRKNRSNDPKELAYQLGLVLLDKCPEEVENTRVAPGFGSRYAAIDTFASSVAAELASSFPENDSLAWGMQFAAALEPVSGGWLLPGVAAAMFVELGFTPNAGAGLFQLAACPGLLAHGIEMSGKPITAMPFVSDNNYHYKGE